MRGYGTVLFTVVDALGIKIHGAREREQLRAFADAARACGAKPQYISVGSVYQGRTGSDTGCTRAGDPKCKTPPFLLLGSEPK